MSLRVAVVQFAPKIGQVQENIEKASKFVANIEPNSVDLVCLPEMIFSGYVFAGASDITPYLEEPQTGPTSDFCAQLAKRLHCYVVAGYPERLASDESRREVTRKSDDANPTLQVGANSVIVYGPGGNFVCNYRKTNLYETDMTWAKPGTGFATLQLPHPLHTVVMGICMDLNVQPPDVWTLEEGPYELAEHSLSQKANVLLLVNAWLDSGEEPEDPKDWRTLNYWAARLRPLWARTEDLEDEGEYDNSDEEEASSDPVARGGETIVIVCNRCGEENGITFAGTSAVFLLTRGSGRPRLLYSMGRRTEGVEAWTI